MIWKTEDMVRLCTNILGSEGFQMEVVSPFGDYNTEAIMIQLTHSPDWVRLYGFRHQHDDNTVSNPKEFEVDAIELCDAASDSRGGIQTLHEPTAIFAARLGVALRAAGWHVAPTTDYYY